MSDIQDTTDDTITSDLPKKSVSSKIIQTSKKLYTEIANIGTVRDNRSPDILQLVDGPFRAPVSGGNWITIWTETAGIMVPCVRTFDHHIQYVMKNPKTKKDMLVDIREEAGPKQFMLDFKYLYPKIRSKRGKMWNFTRKYVFWQFERKIPPTTVNMFYTYYGLEFTLDPRLMDDEHIKQLMQILEKAIMNVEKFGKNNGINQMMEGLNNPKTWWQELGVGILIIVNNLLWLLYLAYGTG